MKPTEEFRIGNRSDALSLLNEMSAKCEEINAASPPTIRGIDKAIGNLGYFWPRLESLKKAIERGIV